LPDGEFLLCHIVRIQVCLLWLAWCAGYERVVVVEAGPGTHVDVEIRKPLSPFRGVVSLELPQKSFIPLPGLAQVDAIDDACGLDELCHRFPVSPGERSSVRANDDRCEPGNLCGEGRGSILWTVTAAGNHRDAREQNEESESFHFSTHDWTRVEDQIRNGPLPLNIPARRASLSGKTAFQGEHRGTW
jgi:hypothetical protein